MNAFLEWLQSIFAIETSNQGLMSDGGSVIDPIGTN